MNAIQNTNPVGLQYILGIPKYGVTYTNHVGSWNNVILKARDLPIHTFIEELRRICSKISYTYREEAEKSQARLIPWATDHCESKKFMVDSLTYRVRTSRHHFPMTSYGRTDSVNIEDDGAAKGNPGKGGIGCIYRDCNVNVSGSLAKGLGLVTNFMAECVAIIHGVEYDASFGWLIAWIESDSTTAVEAFKTSNIPWTLVAAWENASRNMRNIQFSTNWREANFSADALSKKEALLYEGVSMYVMGRPDFLKKIEVPMQEYFRFC
ncbi:hypothetical protein GIB67_003359 [Kingdonia uniflora]|uniref:RNase H type-1 domain-containing protein n=1 Tax=Kingdonia uniflora TaxID=39325 RepID=A0A7J7P8U0_9MAGN|nr:hypothetical protein GIB67_003359 [Kingdonia uniflora]